jgi:very-short-patch-repair endonuclease
MVCLECGKQVRSINYQHLRSCSGITPREYQARHPGAPLIDEDVRTAIGRAGERNPNWQGGKTIKHCECGKRLSRHNRSGFCTSCSRRGDRNPFHGKTHTSETRSRMKDSNQMRDRSTYRGGGADPAILSQRRREEWARRTPEEKERHLRRFIAAGQKHNRKSSRTEIETIVAGILAEMRVEYQQNVQLGRYNVDFLVGTTIIECFGDFWHCNPRLWSAEEYNGSLHMTAREKWGKDTRRKESLESKGYRFCSFWEADIRHDRESVRRQLNAVSTARG